jgi:hypothetical protein
VKWSAAAIVLLAIGQVVPATAQRVRFAPQIGFYIPTERLYDLASGTQSDEFQLEAGLSYGARLGFWFSRRLGIEVGGSYVPTTFLLGGANPVKQDAKLFIGSGQLVLFLIPPTSPLSVFFTGGVATISRGGVAFTDEATTTNVGGVFGVGAGINLGPLALTAGADLVTYRADYQGGQAVSQELRQKDINLKLGFGIPLGGAAAMRP